jgi:hypothetical protein
MEAEMEAEIEAENANANAKQNGLLNDLQHLYIVLYIFIHQIHCVNHDPEPEPSAPDLRCFSNCGHVFRAADVLSTQPARGVRSVARLFPRRNHVSHIV